MNAIMNSRRIFSGFHPSCLALALTALAAVGFAGTANAQYSPVGGDGIAASPRLRRMLNDREGLPATAAAQPPQMMCPACTDVETTAVKRPARGAELMNGAREVVVEHTCPDCDVKWSVAGVGKGRHLVATPTCAADVADKGSSACCALK